ncbi:trypsin II-P29-like [Triplophysa rosa]|uniref:Peptidase S1 domain-containing protein n=1 Tax=Triplophysa rosa TaxID=992332 RepID=A0A9W7WKR6_TRIRA|nr:trypsin II-P29-like [Triplophysa rosa]KAI7803509.1 hypothetical protein IRJ41_007758 [Triplophysa rosa]
MNCYTVLCWAAGAILLNIAGSLCQSDVCGQAPLNTKIVGGQDATSGSWPWQVSVTTTSAGHFCGGGLISKNWVLSAAHCFKSTITSSIILYFGRQSNTGSNPNQVSSRVRLVIKHPSYDESTENNDIALLELSSPVEFTNYIWPICLAATGSTFGAGTKSWITGWGLLIANSNQLPDILQEVEIPIVSDTDCKNAYKGASVVTDNMICAGLLNQGGKDSCQGDSGGPLVSKKDAQWVQSGIVSWGQGCADPGFPGVYAKVSRYQDWITSYTSSDPPGFVQFISNDNTSGSPERFIFTLSLTYSIIPLIFSLYLFS